MQFTKTIMSIVLNFQTLTEKRRKMDACLRDLKTSIALERMAKYAQKRAVQRQNQMEISSNLLPNRPSKPKDLFTEEDAYYDLTTRLRPYMLNSTELTLFLEMLRSRGALLPFADLFALFQKDYLTGVSRLTAKMLEDLVKAFESRKLQPEPTPAVPLIKGSGNPRVILR